MDFLQTMRPRPELDDDVRETAAPSDWQDPFEDVSRIPHHDPVTRFLADEAVETLVALRCPAAPGDPAARLSVLSSLASEIEARYDDTVADARDHGYRWEEIAQRLAISPATARRRYAAYARWRREGCPWPITD
jgi:hypothetical protein